MKTWTKGELQALAAASRFLAISGLLIDALGVFVMVFTWKDFISELPQSLVSPGFLMLFGGTAMIVGGFFLSHYVRKYEERTGQSSTPFKPEQCQPRNRP